MTKPPVFHLLHRPISGSAPSRDAGDKPPQDPPPISPSIVLTPLTAGEALAKRAALRPPGTGFVGRPLAITLGKKKNPPRS